MNYSYILALLLYLYLIFLFCFHPGEELTFQLTQWSIVCSLPESHFTKWSIVFQNDAEVTLTALRKASHSGITGMPLGTTLLIFVSTTNTSITGINVKSIEEKNGIIGSSYSNSLNLIIYGKES